MGMEASEGNWSCQSKPSNVEPSSPWAAQSSSWEHSSVLESAQSRRDIGALLTPKDQAARDPLIPHLPRDAAEGSDLIFLLECWKPQELSLTITMLCSPTSCKMTVNWEIQGAPKAKPYEDPGGDTWRCQGQPCSCCGLVAARVGRAQGCSLSPQTWEMSPSPSSAWRFPLCQDGAGTCEHRW